jgi:hypothetical protein
MIQKRTDLSDERVLHRSSDSSGIAWSRVGVLFLWVLAFGLAASSVASSWESLVGRLARGPRQEAR